MNNHVLEYAFSKQYDEGRILLFTITENGLPYNLDGVSATFQMKKPDGTIIFNNGIIEDNKLKITLTSQATVLTGRIPYQIQLIKDKNVFTTVTGCLKVEKSVVDPEDIISSDEFNALNDALIKVNKDYTYVMESAQASADAAKVSEDNAKISEENSSISEENANISETNAANSANIATEKAGIASAASITATEKANEAINSANESKSYAVGTNNEFRENDAVDNSKYYYEQARSISEGLNGTLLPMGTITFSQLSTQEVSPGYMYNISDSFVTDSTFKDGAGFTYPEGTNIYYTADGYWDCLAGTNVAGVKGNAETNFRKGYINITPENIGLGNVENKSSQMIREELTKKNVTDALGYTPPTTDTNTWRGIQNNLTSTSTTESLSANQGKILADKINNLKESFEKKTFNNNSGNYKIEQISWFSYDLGIAFENFIIQTLIEVPAWTENTYGNYKSTDCRASTHVTSDVGNYTIRIMVDNDGNFTINSLGSAIPKNRIFRANVSYVAY